MLSGPGLGDDGSIDGDDLVPPIGAQSCKASRRLLMDVSDAKFRWFMFFLTVFLQYVSNLAQVYAWGYTT